MGEKSSEKDKKVITLEQCHQTYQNLARNGEIDKDPYNKSATIDIISAILENFSVQILPFPQENERKKLWNKGKKSLFTNYHRMLKCITSKKFNGVFYSSENHSEYAKPSIKDLDTSIQESWTPFQFR